MLIDLFSNKRQGAFLALFLLSGCGSDLLDESQELGPLRVLALIASSPEVNMGTASTSITPWVSDFTQGATRSGYSYSWATCPDPGIAYGAAPQCSTASTLESGGPVAIAPGTLTAGNAYTGVATGAGAITINIPSSSSSFWTSRSLIEKTNGVALIFEFTLTTGTETARSFRRILVKSAGASNTNPLLTDVTVDSVSIAGATGSFPSTEKKLAPIIGAGSQESYTTLTTAGTVLNKTETLTVSWFTTAGEFQFNRTDSSSSNRFTPPESGAPKGLVFLRDDRGGVSAPITIGF
ncbi:MAG: hypothetical protein RJB38_725 [Pseudomonadota bacterium]|jgi:hypothetical protein